MGLYARILLKIKLLIFFLNFYSLAPLVAPLLYTIYSKNRVIKNYVLCKRLTATENYGSADNKKLQLWLLVWP